MAKRHSDIQEQTDTPQMVYGLDIGTTKIVVAAGYLREDGKIEVSACSNVASTGIDFGAVFNVLDTTKDITAAKNMLESNFDCTVDRAHVGIASRHIQSHNYSNSKMRPNGNENYITQDEVDVMLDEMRRLSLPYGRDIIEVVPQYYLVDGKNTMRPVGTLAQRVDAFYQLISGDKADIDKIVNCVTQAQIHCDRLILEPVASAWVCLTEEEKKNGVALIDIGGGTTDLVLYVAGTPVFIKVIPIGGCLITKDIESMGIPFEQAEQLKKQYGTCIVTNASKDSVITIPSLAGYGEEMKISEIHLAEIIGSRVTEIFNFVKEEIKNSGYESSVRTVVLTGGGSLLRDIRSLSEFVIQKKTRIAAPKMGISDTLNPNYCNPVYSTALGLLRHSALSAIPYSAGGSAEDEDDTDDPTAMGFGGLLKKGIDGLVDRISGFAQKVGGMEGAD